MYCKNCGTEIEDGIKYCPQCGTLQTGQSAHQASPESGNCGDAPGNHLVKAIVGLFFCWPFSIAAIVYAFRTDELWRNGDCDGARKSSANANLFGNIAICVGVAFYLLALLFLVAIFGGMTWFASGGGMSI